MRPSIHVTVAAVVEHGGRYLLVEEQVDGDLVINQPAGHVEHGESLVDAVVRETLEETGHRFEPEYFLGIYRWQPRDNDTYLRFAFTGRAEPCQDGPQDPVIKRVLWWDLDQINDAQARLRSPLVTAVIDDFQKGNRYALDCLRNVFSATL